MRKGGAAAPAADFEGTPPEQLGVTPRAVHELFGALAKDPERRASVRCSYVQIYKEQAYDLLNPTSIMMGPDGQQITVPANKKQPGKWHTGAASTQAVPGMGGALRMRWTKISDFYLENLFKVECNSADEALDLFRSGCANKIMASHRLNHSSSRSHCLFTLYIDSSPLASPTEVISSRLTLVDLAGSERGATVGATEGKLRDESVAINKSLFTLRHVITCLANIAQQDARAANGDEASAPAARVNPPYRDSKVGTFLPPSLPPSCHLPATFLPLGFHLLTTF
jgi:hypothetical protein